MTSIVGGWDSEAELAVDGQVGSGPKSGAGGKVDGAKAGGPGLYMIEPSGLYWVCTAKTCGFVLTITVQRYANMFLHRDITVLPPARDDRRPRPNWRSWTSALGNCLCWRV